MAPATGKGRGRLSVNPAFTPRGGKRGALLLNFFPVIQGIDIGVLLLKITVDLPTERMVFLQGAFVCLQVLLSQFPAKPAEQLVEDQPCCVVIFAVVCLVMPLHRVSASKRR